jgi:hypothetical protein
MAKGVPNEIKSALACVALLWDLYQADRASGFAGRT